MRAKSYLFLVLVVVLGIVAGVFYKNTKYNFGLDVRGGVELTYEMVNMTPEQRKQLETIRPRLIDIMQGRASQSLGVVEGVVTAKGDDQILVDLPGFTDTETATKTMGSSAKIQFYWAKNVVSPVDSNRMYRAQDVSGQPEVDFVKTVGDSNVIKPTIVVGGKPEPNPDYAQILKGWDLILEGEDLQSATVQSLGGTYQPSMVFSPAGANKMEAWSRAHADQQENLAAVLDGTVISLAHVKQGTILSDNCVIEGQFTAEYCKHLADLLNAGSLPVDLKILSSQHVDPTIGLQALDKMVTAGVIAFAVIAVFMLVYYAFPGLVAFIALTLYVLFTLTTLKLASATFSLAGIAGFILSVGMAVDANILVFERFKEEMKRGRTLHSAIELGFKRALPAIIDSNACTILTSLVLVELGTGPVKGFATTLIIGVLISLFTAVTVTRSLLVFFADSGIAANPKWYAVERNWFKKYEQRADTEPVQVVNKAARWFWLSGISIAVCLPFVFIGGLKPNVEFRGGYELQYTVGNRGASPDQLSASLEKAGIRGANVKMGGEGAARVAIVNVPLEGPLANTTTEKAQALVGQDLGFQPADSAGSTFIGPAISTETIRNAVLGVVLSSLLIICYLALRFGFAVGGFLSGLRFGTSAIGALIHDVLFVLGVSAVVGFIAHWEISALFITSLLTIIGFSVHDTVVIFDRIRENLRRPKVEDDLAHLMNRSITQSFARSVNTSMTVIVTLSIMLFLGTTTPDLKLFCATMLAGIASGTYSSIYNASPILYLWDRAIFRKKGESETLLGKSRSELAKARIISTQPITSPVQVQQPQAQTPPSQPGQPGGRSYGQVRRRANSPQSRGHVEIEEDL